MSSDWERYRGPADSLLDAIGRTPLVRLARVAPDVELFAKVEWYGPTGSVKDRIYARMLTEADLAKPRDRQSPPAARPAAARPDQ